jgi:septation ring formation regulator EzrA
MILAIFVIVLILWGLGIFTGYTMGGVIHDLKEKKALKVQVEIDEIKHGLGKQT